MIEVPRRSLVHAEGLTELGPANQASSLQVGSLQVGSRQIDPPEGGPPYVCLS